MHGLQRVAGISLVDLLKSVKSFNIMGKGITGQALQESQQIDYDEYISILLSRLKKQGKSILIGIDEIEISDDVRAFGSEYQTLIGDE